MGRESLIERRIRAGLERARALGVSVRAIYLSPQDRQALDKLASRRWGGPVHQLSFDGHPIAGEALVPELTFDGHPLRDGKTSRIYDTHGCSITIPQPARRRATRKGERNAVKEREAREPA